MLLRFFTSFLKSIGYKKLEHRVKPIRIKKTLERPAESIFRYGLDWLQNRLQNSVDSLKSLLHFIVFKQFCETG